MSIAITDELSRGSNGTSPFPLASEANIKVSYVTVSNNTERDAIEEWKRLPYMLCYVSGTDITYRLGANITIAGQVWTVESFGVPDEVLTEDEILNAEGYIKPELIQNIFLNDNFVVASEAAMLALSTRTGNFVIRTDTGEIYVKLNNDDPAALADFAEITYPGAVLSVNGLTGAVTITADTLIAADLAAFNTRVGATTTISTINTDITAIEADITAIEADLLLKADLVAGLVPTSQLPYSFGNGFTGTTAISLGGTLTTSITFDGDVAAPAISFLNMGNITFEGQVYSFSFDDGINDPWELVGDSSDGLRYTTDISANFTNHSLITKQYAGNSYISKTGTNFLTDTTSIIAGVGDSLTLASGTITASNQSRVILGNDSVALTMYNTAQSAAHSLSLGVGGLSYIQGTGTGLSGSGITYAADYSASFGARSLVDKAYVDSVAGVGGGWATTGTTLLTGNAYIEGGSSESIEFNITQASLNTRFYQSGEEIYLQNNVSSTFTDSKIIATASYGSIQSNNATGGVDLKIYHGGSTYLQWGSASGGIQYFADYSADFTDRSLADWGNVWKVKGTTTTSPDGFQINFSDEGFMTGVFEFLPYTFSQWKMYEFGNPTVNAGIEMTTQGISFSTSAATGSLLVFDDIRILLTDGRITKKGIEYGADYSADFTDRSLPDWGNVWRAKGLTTISTAGTTVGISADLTMSTTTTGFQLTEGDAANAFLITDNRTAPEGIVYGSDYSASFTDRSLADWGNVWKAKGNTTISESVLITTTDGSVNSIGVVNGDIGTDYTALSLEGTSIALILNTTTEAAQLVFDHAGALVYFEDSRSTTKGIEYAADYSSEFTDRSLADWGNVWKAKGTTTLSDVNTTVDFTGNTLTFSAGDGLGAGGAFVLNNTEASETVSFGVAGAMSLGGLKYGGDYSTDYTDRSLADWGNVWKVKGATTIQSYATYTLDTVLGGNISIMSAGGTAGIIMDNGTTTYDENGDVELFAICYIGGLTDGLIRFVLDPANNLGLGSGAIFSDTRATKKGIEYAADYSASLTSRSLIDKGYVDNTFLKKNATQDLTSNTRLYLNSGASTSDFYIQSQENGTSENMVSFLMQHIDNLGTSDLLTLSAWDSTGASASLQFKGIAAGDVVFIDNRLTTKGLLYDADYSTGFTSRSLIDKGYADSKYWKVTGDTTISGISNNILIENPTDLITFKTKDTPDLISSTLRIGGGAIYLESFASDGYSGASILATLENGEFFITDFNTTKKGIQYSGDYSAGFGARSLIDKGFFDSKHLTNTASLNFPSTATNLSADLTITVTGAALGDAVVLGVPHAAVFADSCYTAWVSAANTVTVRFNNYGATTRDPTAQTFRVTVLKP